MVPLWLSIAVTEKTKKIMEWHLACLDYFGEYKALSRRHDVSLNTAIMTWREYSAVI
jgi:hypothetical protein